MAGGLSRRSDGHRPSLDHRSRRMAPAGMADEEATATGLPRGGRGVQEGALGQGRAGDGTAGAAGRARGFVGQVVRGGGDGRPRCTCVMDHSQRAPSGPCLTSLHDADNRLAVERQELVPLGLEVRITVANANPYDGGGAWRERRSDGPGIRRDPSRGAAHQKGGAGIPHRRADTYLAQGKSRAAGVLANPCGAGMRTPPSDGWIWHGWKRNIPKGLSVSSVKAGRSACAQALITHSFDHRGRLPFCTLPRGIA